MNGAKITITPTGDLAASTFGAGAFAVTNNGTTSIQGLILRLDKALLSGLIFDPAGLAGDTVAKDFSLDGETGDGVGVSHGFLDGSDASGWRTLALGFTDFEPGESFTFSLDVDPSSIKGTSSPGPAESGSVSGLEMVGSDVEVQFSDGATSGGRLFAIPGSVSGSTVQLGANLPEAPTLTVTGGGSAPATVSDAAQQIVVSGPAGAAFRLIVVEGGRFTDAAVDPTAPDLGAFAANTALAVTEFEGTLGSDGTALVDVTLTKSNVPSTAGESGTSGVNIITAVLVDAEGRAGASATPLVLELVENVPDSEVVAAINVGGGSYTATDGTVYEADTFSTGGFTFATSSPIAGTNDDPLYQSERWASGSLGYDIPIANGDYLVALQFAEIYFTSAGQRLFSVALEGLERLSDLDLAGEVGPLAAFDLTLPVSVTDGSLDVDLIAGIENPKLSAIKVATAGQQGDQAPTDLDVSPKFFDEETVYSGTLVANDTDSASFAFSLIDDPSGLFAITGNQLQSSQPIDFEALPQGFTDQGDGTATIDLTLQVADESGNTHAESINLTVRDVDEDAPASVVVKAINAGGGSYTAADGTLYDADTFFSGGSTYATSTAISGTSDDPLYQSERWAPGGLGYDIPITDGDYLVTLQFAEIFFSGAGQRQFTVALEGLERLSDLDVAAEVGSFAAFDVSLPVSVTDGTLNIDLIAGIENPKLSAIKVATTEQPGAQPPTDLDVSPKIFAEETVYSGTLVVTDADSTSFTYSLVDDPSGLFTISGDQLTLLSPIDFENLPSAFAAEGDGAATIDLTLQVTDESGNSLEEIVTLTVTDVDEGSQPVNFEVTNLSGESVAVPTSLQFGPDGRLYVADIFGLIHVFEIVETPTGFSVVDEEVIDLVQGIPNHDDNGTVNTGITQRQVTGLVVTGTTDEPVIYVSSSDPRWGGGATGGDTNLDTNSGIISCLTPTPDGWQKVDIVRGLPRSEENHSTNGLQFDAATNTLLVAQGGNTNAGAPSQKFAYLSEYALSAAVLAIDLGQIAAFESQGLKGTDTPNPYVYDLPTVDDPTRGDDDLTPFGGNDGLNMARLVEGGPVQVFAPGFRNVYDTVITESGRIYTIDNGPNQTWGGYPTNTGTDGTVTNAYDPSEPGSATVNNLDGLHLIGTIDTPGYYGGHPVPLRANPRGAGLYTNDDQGTAVWRQQGGGGSLDLPADWLPVDPSLANPVEGEYRSPGDASGALYTWSTLSVNGIAEYTASAFGGQLQNELLAAALTNDTLYRIQLNEAGDAVVAVLPLASNFASQPIDIVSPGDDDPFPGTVWIASLDGTITVLRPAGSGGTLEDADGDGYSDNDEIANATDPLNAADRPPDFDGDLVSNLADTDDDDDGLADPLDHFARDATNGTDVVITATEDLFYPLFGTDPGTGFFGLGFTGLMSNGTTDYLDQFDPDNLIPGGATGTFTVVETTPGDAILQSNGQDNAFQFGVMLDQSMDSVVVSARLLNPFTGKTPQSYQSAGMFIGTGDQDNYVKIVVAAADGNGGIEVLYEEGGQLVSSVVYGVPGIFTAETVDLFLTINLEAGVVTPSWTFSDSGGPVTVDIGNDLVVAGNVLAAVAGEYTNGGLSSGLAIGTINTHFGTDEPIAASYDHIAVYAAPGASASLASLVVDPEDENVILVPEGTDTSSTSPADSGATAGSLAMAELIDDQGQASNSEASAASDTVSAPMTLSLEGMLVEQTPTLEA